MTEPPNAVAAKGGQMAIRSESANYAPSRTTMTIDGEESPSFPFEGLVLKLAQQLLRCTCIASVCVLVASSSGCTITSGVCRAIKKSECIDDFMISYRNKAMAEKAWHCQQDRFCNIQNPREFKDGFISGYLDVANGGAGCCPSMAPRRYWGWKYQSAGGQNAINAWFQGFPMGVQAAEQDGVGHMQQVVINRAAVPTSAPLNAIHGQLPEVTNPFYSDYPEHEFVPAPEGIIDSPIRGDVEVAAPVQPNPVPPALPDSAFAPGSPEVYREAPMVSEPANVEPELVFEPHVDAIRSAPATSLGVQSVPAVTANDAPGFDPRATLPFVEEIPLGNPNVEPPVAIGQPVISGPAVAKDWFDDPTAHTPVIAAEPLTGERMTFSDQGELDIAPVDDVEVSDVIDGIFGTPAQPVQTDISSDELPFTFE